MKKIFFILVGISLFACSDTLKDRKTTFFSSESLKEYSKFIQTWEGADSLKKLEMEYGIYHDKKHIPASVIEYLSQKYSDYDSKSEWKIANPDEEVDLGCVVRDELPRRQLLALAKEDKYCIIYYLGGGEGISREIMILSLDNHQVINDTFFQEEKPMFMETVKKLSQRR